MFHCLSNIRAKMNECINFNLLSKQLDEEVPIPVHKGYSFKFGNGEVKLIRNFLFENGFVESTTQPFTIYWCIGPIKHEIYQALMRYQKVSHYLIITIGESFSSLK
jgi:hypothetical protein